MNKLFFWNAWSKPYRIFYLSVLAVFFLSVVFYAVAWYMGLEGVVGWSVQSDLSPVSVGIDEFSRNLYSYTLETEVQLTSQKYIATDVQPGGIPVALYLLFVTVGMLLILTAISYLELVWFMIGMACFGGFLVSLRLEVLGLFGRYNFTPMFILFVLFGGLSYYFNFFNKTLSFFARFGIYMILSTAAAFVIWKFAAVKYPFLAMTNYSAIFPFLIALVVLFFTGYDIIKVFLLIITQRRIDRNANTIGQFAIITGLYLINVLLMLLRKTYAISFDFLYLSPWLLFLASLLLGIWMFKKRSEQFGSVLPFAPAGALVFLGLGLISVAGIAYAQINGNIGLLHAYERMIAYVHFFLGLGFFIYVLVNFSFLFDQKINLFDIVYQGKRMTFFFVPLIAVAGTSFFYFRHQRYDTYLLNSGLYTYKGDYYKTEGDYPLAIQYYRNGLANEHVSHRVNYSIASLKHYLGQRGEAISYYKNAIYRNPSPQAYIGLANALEENNDWLEAFFALRNGLNKFPDNGQLLNNYALLSGRTRMHDSTFYYLDIAKQNLGDGELVEANKIYICAKHNLKELGDSLYLAYPQPGLARESNYLALMCRANRLHRAPVHPEFMQDTVCDGQKLVYLMNYNVNHLGRRDTLLVNRMRTFLQSPSNTDNFDWINHQLALWEYYSGNRLKAMGSMLNLKNNNPFDLRYARTLAHWTMEQELYPLAVENYKESTRDFNAVMQLNYCLASTELGIPDSADFEMNQLLAAPDSSSPNKKAAKQLRLVQTQTRTTLAAQDEATRLQYLHWHLNELSDAEVLSLVKSLKNENMISLAAAERKKWFMDRGMEEAFRQWIREEGAVYSVLGATVPYHAYEDLRLALRQQNLTELQSLVNIDSLWSSDRRDALHYARGVLAESQKKSADIYYLAALERYPYFAEGLPLAQRYLNEHQQAEAVYERLGAAMDFYPYHLPLALAFFDQCMFMKYYGNAEITLRNLSGQISQEAYQIRKAQLDKALEQ